MLREASICLSRTIIVGRPSTGPWTSARDAAVLCSALNLTSSDFGDLPRHLGTRPRAASRSEAIRDQPSYAMSRTTSS